MLYVHLLLRWNCIFSIPLHPLLKDYMMALHILCLTIIDIATYTVMEGVRENLGVKLTASQELPENTIGVIFLS